MKRRNDIYNVGNDYNQEVSAYFCDTEDEVKKVSGYGLPYSDGLYHYTKKPVYELSGGEDVLNKRVFNKLPQSSWTAPDLGDNASAFSAINDASAVLSPDYATVEDADDRVWKKPTP